MPGCTAASDKCRKVLQVSNLSAKGWSLVCWQGLLESAKRGNKEHWDKLVFKEGCKLVFWLNRQMQLKQDWKPTWAGTWSHADRLNPLKGRLLSCLSESWHFWVLFVLLVITPCPSMPYCMFPGGVTFCGLSVSPFLAHPCFSCACLGLEASAWGLMLSIYFCTWMLLDDLGSE